MNDSWDSPPRKTTMKSPGPLGFPRPSEAATRRATSSSAATRPTWRGGGATTCSAVSTGARGLLGFQPETC